MFSFTNAPKLHVTADTSGLQHIGIMDTEDITLSDIESNNFCPMEIRDMLCLLLEVFNSVIFKRQWALASFSLQQKGEKLPTIQQVWGQTKEKLRIIGELFQSGNITFENASELLKNIPEDAKRAELEFLLPGEVALIGRRLTQVGELHHLLSLRAKAKKLMEAKCLLMLHGDFSSLKILTEVLTFLF